MSEDIMEIDRAKEPYTYFSISTVQTLAQTIARLQEQLKEANEAIMSMVGNGPYTADEIGQAYLEKWGVK